MTARVTLASPLSSSSLRLRPDLALTPLEVLARWPRERALACVWAEPDPLGLPWARWTVIAEPTECRTWGALATREEVLAGWRAIRAGGGRTGAPPGPDAPTFQGGWLGYSGYGLGGLLEPSAVGAVRPEDDWVWPLAAWWRCADALMHDALTGRWWSVGEPPDPMSERTRVSGAEEFRIGRLSSRTGREGFEAAVARVVEYIRAGDIFQANLTHRLSGEFSGSTRALFRALVRSAAPRHGAYLELPTGGAIVSASPELFLTFDAASRRVTTRPMKGTRPAAAGAGELERSEKDRAELAMIVDLMRNDLGRVCDFGSIRVAEPRAIERHGPAASGVYQGVATVHGRLRAGLDLADLFGATFPGGSVTGAPKIRAMQIIEELEPVARGPYCGAIGMISDSGDAVFNIAIRTALVAGGRLDYGVGAGIVAESDPAAEWAETMAKAGAILGLAAHGAAPRASTGAAR